jgi:hypothetical protein
MPTRGEVFDEFATGNGLGPFNRPLGTEVIFGVGASHQANRSRDLLGLPPRPIDFPAPVDASAKLVAALKRPPLGWAMCNFSASTGEVTDSESKGFELRAHELFLKATAENLPLRSASTRSFSSWIFESNRVA